MADQIKISELERSGSLDENSIFPVSINVGTGSSQTVGVSFTDLHAAISAATPSLEMVYDAIAVALQAGAGISITSNDGADTTTISSTITQYTDEQVRDVIGAALTAGSGITITPNDGSDIITITCSVTQYTDEMARDALGTALTAGSGISITPNDGSDTISIASSITQYTDEMARDALGSALVAGSGIGISVNDGGDTITVTSLYAATPIAPGGGSYTDEQARDAVGSALVAGSGISISVNDPSDTITITSIYAATPITGTSSATPSVKTAFYTTSWPSRPTAESVIWVSATPNTATPSAAQNNDIVILPPPYDVLGFALSNMTSVITTGTMKEGFHAPYPFDIKSLRLELATPSTSGVVTVDINKDGSTILSPKITIDANEYTSTTAATPYSLLSIAVSDGAFVTFDIDTSGTNAGGLKLWIYHQRKD